MSSSGPHRRQLLQTMLAGVLAFGVGRIGPARPGQPGARLAGAGPPPAEPTVHHFMDRLTPGLTGEPAGYAPPETPAWARAHTDMDHERLRATRYPL